MHGPGIKKQSTINQEALMKKLTVLMAVLMAACFVMPAMAQPALTSAPDAGVAKLTYGPDKWIDAHLLFQMQYTATRTWDKSVEKEGDNEWVSNFAPRRMRMVFSGQVAPNVTFFAETDIVNSVVQAQKADLSDAGLKNEQWMVFLQDAYINLKVAEEFQVAFGMILLPFTHHNRQSAVSLLGVDYNTTFVGNSIPQDTVWRDYGVEFRGLLANKMIDYRIGVFDGVERDMDVDNDTDANEDDNINPKGLPRVTGRVQINLMDAEDRFFYSGNYLGKKKIVSFGGGIDYMKAVEYVAADNEAVDYLAWTVDVTIDYPISPNMVIAFQAAYVNMENSTDSTAETSQAYFAQAGLLLNGMFQPVIKYETYVNEYDAGDNTISYLHVGFNYFINGHNANIKIDYRHPMGEDESGAVAVEQIGRAHV